MENIFSSEMQEEIKFVTSPAVQETIKFINSPAVQEAIEFINSPAVQEAIEFINSPAVQEAIKFMNSPAILQTLAQTPYLAAKCNFVNKIYSPDEKRIRGTSCTLDKSNSLFHLFENAVSASSPYITSKSEDRTETAVSTVRLKQKLTLSDILTLINILITIYGLILSSRPNEQLERIIAQNDAIIEQQAEMIELSKEDRELSNTLNSLTDSIDLLTDEAELLCERLEGLNNSADAISQADAGNGEQKNTDAEE